MRKEAVRIVSTQSLPRVCHAIQSQLTLRLRIQREEYPALNDIPPETMKTIGHLVDLGLW